jgi:hypothetical protein
MANLMPRSASGLVWGKPSGGGKGSIVGAIHHNSLQNQVL